MVISNLRKLASNQSPQKWAGISRLVLCTLQNSTVIGILYANCQLVFDLLSFRKMSMLTTASLLISQNYAQICCYTKTRLMSTISWAFQVTDFEQKKKEPSSPGHGFSFQNKYIEIEWYTSIIPRFRYLDVKIWHKSRPLLKISHCKYIWQKCCHIHTERILEVFRHPK